MTSLTKDDRERRDARREARTNGYEYRPTTAQQSRDAERLNRGLEVLDGADDGDFEDRD